MKPNLDFHGIASLRLTDVVTLTRSDGTTFSYRNIELTDAKGDRFVVGLFADTADALRVSEPKSAPAKDTTPPPALDPKTGRMIAW